MSKNQAFASQFDMLQQALKRVFPTTSDGRFSDLLAALDAPTPADENDTMSDDRQEARFPLEIWGFYRTPNGGKRDILLKDISETGCRFFDKFSGLVPDQE